MTDLYNENFYTDQQDGSVASAKIILPLVLDILPPVKSVVDFGCGVGSWLSVLREHGVTEIQGIDGDWVQTEMLKIPAQNFRQIDLDKAIVLDKKYDLAMSLEVAEHLCPEAAADFVKSICNASDFILFSAAIPGQGGTGHINEQRHSYWIALFAENGYTMFDAIRPQIWHNDSIEVCYRQNALLFSRNADCIENKFDAVYADVHPGTLAGYVSLSKEIRKKIARRKLERQIFAVLLLILVVSNVIGWIL